MSSLYHIFCTKTPDFGINVIRSYILKEEVPYGYEPIKDRTIKIKDTKEESTGYGRYIRSNESVSNEIEETTNNGNETDSFWDDIFGFQLPKTIAEQVTNPSASNDWEQVTKSMVAEEPELYVPRH